MSSRAACALAAVLGWVSAQEPALRLRADSRLVLTPVTVHDEHGRAVAGLGPEHFHVFDDGAPRTISQFDTDESPMALGIVLDASSSMRRTAPETPLAIPIVLGQARRGDEFFLIEFQDSPRLVVPLTLDPDEIVGNVGRSTPAGRTALYDAVLLGLREIAKAESQRRALLVITDGMDNQSILSYAQIDRFVRESAIPIYTLAIVTRELRTPDLMGIEWLRRTAELTGGRKFESRAEDLSEAARRIALDLRAQYVLGFQAPGAGDGRYHKLRVEVVPTAGAAKPRAVWRPGYLAPGL